MYGEAGVGVYTLQVVARTKREFVTMAPDGGALHAAVEPGGPTHTGPKILKITPSAEGSVGVPGRYSVTKLYVRFAAVQMPDEFTMYSAAEPDSK